MAASTLQCGLVCWYLCCFFFFFFKGEGRETLDTVFAKQSLRFLEQREKDDIVKSLGKPGSKVHTMFVRVLVRCRDSGHGDSTTLLCLKLI